MHITLVISRLSHPRVDYWAMRIAPLTAILLLGLSSLASAETAQVTFFSNHSMAKLLLPISHDAAFVGYLFDGEQELVLLQHNQFVTINLPVGSHSFSAGSGRKHRPKKGALTIQLAGGEHYFVAASTNVGLISDGAVLEELDCQAARLRAEHTIAAPLKHVDKNTQGNLVSETSFPSCAP